jgi:hypothetical protein
MTNSNTYFRWPSWVPAGHRSIESSSSNIRKNINHLTLVMSDETIIDVFDDTDKLDNIERLTIACAAAGAFAGIRYNLPSGYIVAAALNAPDHLRPDDPVNKKLKSIKNGTFKDAHIEVSFGDIKLTCTVDELMSLTFLQAKIVFQSAPVTIASTAKEPPPPVEIMSQEDLANLYKKRA